MNLIQRIANAFKIWAPWSSLKMLHNDAAPLPLYLRELEGRLPPAPPQVRHCKKCSVGYLARPTGSNPPEDGFCRVHSPGSSYAAVGCRAPVIRLEDLSRIDSIRRHIGPARRLAGR